MKTTIHLTEQQLHNVISEAIHEMLDQTQDKFQTPAKISPRVKLLDRRDMEFYDDSRQYLFKCHLGVRDKYAFKTLGRNFGGGNIWYIEIYKKVPNSTSYKHFASTQELTKQEIFQKMQDSTLFGDKVHFYITLEEIHNGFQSVQSIASKLKQQGISAAQELINNTDPQHLQYLQNEVDYGRYDGYFDNPDYPIAHSLKSIAIKWMKEYIKQALLDYYNWVDNRY